MDEFNDFQDIDLPKELNSVRHLKSMRVTTLTVDEKVEMFNTYN